MQGAFDIFRTFQTRLDNMQATLNRAEKQPRSEYTGGFQRRTVAELSSIVGMAGQCYFATNGRKGGEGVGAGTGLPVYWNPATSQWYNFYNNTVVAA